MIEPKVFVLFIVLFSCKSNDITQQNKEYPENIDRDFVVNKSYNIGDVRRYGVYPDEDISLINLKNALDVSEKGIELFFPKGVYNRGLNIDSRKDIYLKFDSSEFLDVIHITDENGTSSENINFEGTLITYDRFGTYGSNNINVDTLIIKSNPLKHSRGYKSRGCHIYSRTKNLSINYLQIEGLGDDHPNNHAAIAVDGDFPKNISIKKAVINSSDRNGVYLTGANHKIDTLMIKNWGGKLEEYVTNARGFKRRRFLLLWYMV